MGWVVCAIYPSFAQLAEFEPASTTGLVVKHPSYWYSYSVAARQAEWVYYLLTPQRVKGGAKRKNNFCEDPALDTLQAGLADYKGTGYDRGHLCPAADNAHSVEAMGDSFYLTNMSPQQPGFNRGVWKRLEGAFRAWVVEVDSLYVVTGGVLETPLDSIGQRRVWVPAYFYKIGLQLGADTTAIGFLLPNKNSKEPLAHFMVTVDSIETVTGIDFFYKLKNQENFESTIPVPNRWAKDP